MRSLGVTSSAYSYTPTYNTFVYPTTQITNTLVASKTATIPAAFAIGNGYIAVHGSSTGTATTSSVAYTSNRLTDTSINWNIASVQSIGNARGITYIDTVSNKYWVYGQDLNGTFYYTTDGTPFGTMSSVSVGGSNSTSAAYMIYFPEASKFVAFGTSAATGVYAASASSISGPWTLSTGISETIGNSGVQGVTIAKTGTGTDKRVIFTVGGNGANSTYFSAVNDPSSFTKQTLTGGDCRGIAFTGTHILYLGDNSFGRAPISTFSGTTGAVVSYSNLTGYPSTVRGMWADPNGSGLAWLSGGTSALYSTDHGATWTSVSSLANITSQWKMWANDMFAIIYSSGDLDIAYNRFR